MQLKAFKSACLLLPVRKIPVKMHITIAHLDRAIRETNRGLGCDSEQWLEDSHQGFAKVWRRYIVRDVYSDVYAERLLRAVLTYNTSHIPQSTEK